jgi:hypothetical protein
MSHNHGNLKVYRYKSQQKPAPQSSAWSNALLQARALRNLFLISPMVFALQRNQSRIPSSAISFKHQFSHMAPDMPSQSFVL